MKNIFAFIIGLIGIPLLLFFVFYGIDELLVYTTNTELIKIVNGPLSVVQTLITICIIVTWFITNPLKADWDIDN